jgi:hypothetical protein
MASSLDNPCLKCGADLLSIAQGGKPISLSTVLDVIFIVLLRTGTTTPFRLLAMMKSSIPLSKVDADDADPKVRLP